MKKGNLEYKTRIDPITGKQEPVEGLRKVFVSYKKDDIRRVNVRDLTIGKILEIADLAVWYDANLTGGRDYKDELIQAVSECDALILLLTENILDSDYVWEVEVATATQQEKPIIPIAFDLAPDKYIEVEKRIGHEIQILRWADERQIESGHKSLSDFDNSFRRSLQEHVLNIDLNNRVVAFFKSDKHTQSMANLSPANRFLMGYGYLNGVGVEQDVEKGIQILENIVNEPYDDKEINKLKSDSAMVLADHYFDLDDFEKDFYYCQKAAELGDAKAMNHLGWMYRKGKGVQQSYEKAFEWYAKAAQLGNARSVNNLGHMYFNGRGVQQSYEKAFECYDKAAELGVADAMNSIGWMYDEGLGVEQSCEKAVEWYTKAAELGDAMAMNNLGNMYEDGRGVEQDYEKANDWYAKAADRYAKDAELGDADAMCDLGVMYEDGRGVEQSDEKAIEWFTKAAELDNEEAIEALILLLGKGKNKFGQSRRNRLRKKITKKYKIEEKIRLKQERKQNKRKK